MTHYDYLIVGGGMVADAAARGIRELDARGSIGILSADVDPPYARPALTKKLWTDPDFSWDQVPLGTVHDTGAELQLETLVTSIDREHRAVSTEDGREVEYGKLLLATGGRPRGLVAPQDDRIVVFRSARDYWRLRDLAGPGTRVAIVGGGYIGSELAAGLAITGSAVTLIHPEPVLGASILPDDVAQPYAAMFREHGVTLLDGRKALRAVAESHGILLELDDGSTVGAEAVVVGLGIEPVTGIAERAGLEVDDGIVVDEQLHTTDEAIWAAGDIAKYPDAILGPVRIEHVDNAQSMGKAVGRAMAGDHSPYTHTPYFYSVVFEQRWEAIGRVDSRLDVIEDWFDPTALGIVDRKGVIYYLDGGRAVGVLLWNVKDARETARRVIADPPARPEQLIGRIR